MPLMPSYTLIEEKDREEQEAPGGQGRQWHQDRLLAQKSAVKGIRDFHIGASYNS